MLNRTLRRARFPLLYAGFYLVIGAVVARVSNALALADAAPIIAGIGVFVAIALLRDTGISSLREHPAVYLGLQTVIAASLLALEPDLDFLALLFVVLSLQAVLLLSEKSGYLWLFGLALLTLLLFLINRAPGDAIAFTLTYCAAYVFVDLLAKAVVESETARERSEGLLAELRDKEATSRELAVSEERNRLAREIHDTLAQGLTGIVLQLEAAEQSLTDAPAEAASRIGRATSLARESLQEARRSVWNLLPRALEERGVEDALRDEVRRFAAEGQERTSFNVHGERLHLTSEVEKALLRVCQESLNNVRKHAAASEVSVMLSYRSDCVQLRVVDNGVGIEASAREANRAAQGRGLAGMEERARILRGTFVAGRAEPKGTLVQIEIPLAGAG
jgi:signal transduction histidine kinase